jgi:hypothetical protein
MCKCGELIGVNPDLCDHAVAREMSRGTVPMRNTVTFTKAWLSVGVHRIELTANGSRMVLKITVSRRKD